MPRKTTATGSKRKAAKSSRIPTPQPSPMAPLDALAPPAQLRVWHIPQVPGARFFVPVESVAQARLILDTLARYDAFQLEHNIKPDYSNVGGLEVFEDGEWIEWEDDDGCDISASTMARAG
ncbi:MAG TPA: hypothetical protein VFO62_10495 [Candidatus Binatia bacterium]|nr:hypothetical protein [Candidatus Binatia bacterium]